jgi:hypothetical protein
MEETQFESLLRQYKHVNEQLHKSQRLNKKILNTMVTNNIQRSTRFVKRNDLYTFILFVLMMAGSLYCNVRSFHRMDLFLLSIAWTFILVVYMTIYYYYFEWKLSPELYKESDSLIQGLERLKQATININKQRKWGMGFILCCPLAFPALWHLLGFDYRDIISNSYWNVFFMLLLALAFLIGYKLYDWIYLNAIQKIRMNILSLQEEGGKLEELAD